VNPWDVVTWVAAVALALSGSVIFGFFLRDVRGVLNRDLHHSDDESTPPSNEPQP
jgi:hypothetical protein